MEKIARHLLCLRSVEVFAKLFFVDANKVIQPIVWDFHSRCIANGFGDARHEKRVTQLIKSILPGTIQDTYSLTAIGRPAVAKTAMIELSACV